MLRNQKGFTLVELVIVIVIIGILAAIAIPKFADLSTSAKESACIQNQAAIESAATVYFARSAIDPTDVGLAAGTAAKYPASIAIMTGAAVDLLPAAFTGTCEVTGAALNETLLESDGLISCDNGCGA